MPPEDAALCRHVGAPSEAQIDRVEKVVREIGNDVQFLEGKGLLPDEFAAALPLVIEKMRGSASASTSDRKAFVDRILEFLRTSGKIASFDRPDYGDDTVYRVHLNDGRNVAIIQKGCPDGAHGSVRWTRPDWAIEAYLWWLCDGLAHEPGEHVAKGVNRLRSRFFDTGYDDAVDGVIFHNQLCGTPDRPCPKMSRAASIEGIRVPPPCVWVMPAREGLDDHARTEWNWDGSRKRVFPSVLLSAFGIADHEVPMFVGDIGFQKAPRGIRNRITSRAGPALVTQYKGNAR